MAFDVFLKIDGIEGESKDTKHSKEIQIQTFHWSAAQPHSPSLGGGVSGGKVEMQGFTFTTRASKASPKLLLACAQGETFKKATLVCRKADKEQIEYMTITMTNVLVSSYQLLGEPNGRDDLPMDQVSLSFDQIEYEYKEQKDTGGASGKAKAGWNLRTNKAV